jgi:hypothetical protein
MILATKIVLTMEACENQRVHEGIKGENPRGFTNV